MTIFFLYKFSPFYLEPPVKGNPQFNWERSCSAFNGQVHFID